MPDAETGKSEANELVAFSELFCFLDSDESAPARPAPDRYDAEPEDDGREESAPLSAEITHQKWFTDELSAPDAEIADAPKPPRPALRLSESQAVATGEAMQQAFSALAHAAAYDWPGPALPLQDEIVLPEPHPAPPVAAAPSPAAPRPVAPEWRDPPAFAPAPPPQRQPFAPPKSPLTARDGAPPGIEASLSALESVLGGGNSTAANEERHRRSELVREADLAGGRHEPYFAPAHTRSPLGQIADRIVRELENISTPSAPRRTG